VTDAQNSNSRPQIQKSCKKDYKDRSCASVYKQTWFSFKDYSKEWWKWIVCASLPCCPLRRIVSARFEI